jgi:hypothetical protein
LEACAGNYPLRGWVFLGKEQVMSPLNLLLPLILGLTSAAAWGQDMPDNGPPPGGPPPPGMFDPNAMRQRMMDDLKGRLAMSDDEFSAIQPKLEQLMQLQREVDSRGMMDPGPGMPPPPGGEAGGPPAQTPGGGGPPPEFQPSDLRQKIQDLGDTLNNADSTPAQIKAKLNAVRAAKAKAREELSQAQQNLISLLTPRQEAVLAAMGLLP